MPIKHQNDALLRQLYGITADGWRRLATIDSLFVNNHLGRQSNPRPVHRGEFEGRKFEEKWKMEEGDDYGAQSERRDWFIAKRGRGKWTIFQWIDGEREREREKEEFNGKMEFSRRKMEFWAHQGPARGVSAVIRATVTLRWFCECFDTSRSDGYGGARIGRRSMGRTVSYDFRLAPATAAAPMALWMYAWDTNFMLYALNAPMIRSRTRTPRFPLTSEAASSEEGRGRDASLLSQYPPRYGQIRSIS